MVDKKYKELDFWVPNFKLFKALQDIEKGSEASEIYLHGPVVWPGGLRTEVNNNESFPLGWKIPTADEALKVAVPGNPAFENFVKRESNGKYVGLSIEVFEHVQGQLKNKYSGLPYNYISVHVSYDDLIQSVANQVKPQLYIFHFFLYYLTLSVSVKF